MENKTELLKLLREKTGAGMIDCKKALDQANGDVDKAIEILRKEGITRAVKRSEREANQGVIKVAVSQNEKSGYILEVNAETDFVVRSEKFQALADRLINFAEEKEPKNLAELLSLNLGQGTAREELGSLSGIIGEKLEIKRYEVLNSGGTVAAYSHLGGKIGVLVALDKAGQRELAYDIAMQVAAANPKYIKPEDVQAEELAKEKEVYRAQLIKEGKPGNMIDKIIVGKLAKYYEEICLMKQEYIKDDAKRVADVLGDVKVEKYIRYSL